MFLEGPHFQIVAGQAVVDAIRASRATVRPSASRPGCLDSESLCLAQQHDAAHGVLGAEIIQSNYGCSVRYDSGLQDFGLLASARRRDIDGTYEAAVAWATRWQAEDPTRRYVWTRRP